MKPDSPSATRRGALKAALAAAALLLGRRAAPAPRPRPPVRWIGHG